MGSLLLTAGSPGLRHSLPNARIMIHQPHGGAEVCKMMHLSCPLRFVFVFIYSQGQATDIEIQANEILKLKKQLTYLYVKHTKQTFELLHGKMERDTFLSPDDAKALGLIDSVLEHPPATVPDDNQSTN